MFILLDCRSEHAVAHLMREMPGVLNATKVIGRGADCLEDRLKDDTFSMGG